MTLRDMQRDIRKRDTNDLKDAGASAALGGAVGAAAMPVRPLKPRGKRQAEAQDLWRQAERAGGKPGKSANVSINPDNFVRIGQVKGHRLFNDKRVADQAYKQALPKKDPRHLDERKTRYVTTAYKDEKGNVTLRQQNGRHGAEALAMRGKNIPATVHLEDGPPPTEKNAVKAVYRHIASNWEGKRMGSNLRLPSKAIESKARKYPQFAHKINEYGHDRLGYKAGSSKETLPWRHGKAMSTKQLRTKQAAYIGGGAAGLAAANYLSEKVSGKGVGNEALKAGKKSTDYTRHQVADIIDPNRSVKKMYTEARFATPEEIQQYGLDTRTRTTKTGKIFRKKKQTTVLQPVLAKDRDYNRDKAFVFRYAEPGEDLNTPAVKQVNQFSSHVGGETGIRKGLPRALKADPAKVINGTTRNGERYLLRRLAAHHGGRQAAQVHAWGRMDSGMDLMLSAQGERKLSRKLLNGMNRGVVSKASDRTERTAAAATGATAGVMLMPMRDKIGKNPKKFAQKYSGLKSGKHDISSRDLQTIAAPGFREKKKIWKDPKTNLAYTDKMGAAIKRGKMKPARPRVVIYDDAARITGGQHRVHATAYAGQKKQRAEVVRVKGYYGGTERGHKAIRSRIKRATYPKMFLEHTPKNTKELMRRDKAISAESVAAARKGATDTDRVPFHKPFTKKGLRLLKMKQAGYIAGGAGTVVAAREMYRRRQ